MGHHSITENCSNVVLLISALAHMSSHVTEPLLKWDHRSTDDAKINVAQNANGSNDNQPSFNKERVENVWKNPKYNNNNRKKSYT